MASALRELPVYNKVQITALVSSFIRRHRLSSVEAVIGGSAACVYYNLRKSASKIDLYIKQPAYESIKESGFYPIQQARKQVYIDYSNEIRLHPLVPHVKIKLVDTVCCYSPEWILEQMQKTNTNYVQRDICMLKFYIDQKAKGNVATIEKFDASKVPEIPTFIGVLNQGGDMDRLARRFGKRWAMAPINNARFVTDRHDTQIVLELDVDGKPITFSVYNEEDADVFRLGLPMKSLRPVKTVVVDPTYTYLGEQMIAVLKEMNLW